MDHTHRTCTFARTYQSIWFPIFPGDSFILCSKTNSTNNFLPRYNNTFWLEWARSYTTVIIISSLLYVKISICSWLIHILVCINCFCLLLAKIGHYSISRGVILQISMRSCLVYCVKCIKSIWLSLFNRCIYHCSLMFKIHLSCSISM